MNSDPIRIPGSRAVGRFLEETRKTYGLSRKELARRTGLNFEDIKVIERRVHKTFRADHVALICAEFDIDELPKEKEEATQPIDLWWKPPETLTLTRADRVRFRERRKTLGKTQNEIAEAAGLSASTYQMLEWEKSVFTPTPEALAAIATALEIPRKGVWRRAMRKLGFRFIGPVKHAQRTSREIDWEQVPWGTKSDGDLAVELRTTLATVFRERQRRGIPAFAGKKRAPSHYVAYTADDLLAELGDPPITDGKVDWTKVPLGCTTDTEIADWLGCPRDRVRYARATRKIPSWSPVQWENVPLGKFPDTVIAEWLPVSFVAVRARRVKMRIPSAPLHSRKNGEEAFVTYKPPPGILTPREFRFPSV